MNRAGPGVSPASPWARATPTPKKIYIIHIKKKKNYTYTLEKKNCIHKTKFLLEGKKNIQKTKMKNNHKIGGQKKLLRAKIKINHKPKEQKKILRAKIKINHKPGVQKKNLEGKNKN